MSEVADGWFDCCSKRDMNYDRASTRQQGYASCDFFAFVERMGARWF
jgi:hypothetical protein